MRYVLKLGPDALLLDVERSADGTYRVRDPDGKELFVTPLAQQSGLLAVLVSGQVLEVQPSEGEVRLAGKRFSVRTESERDHRAARTAAGDSTGSKEIVAPMPGRVVRVSCAAGAAVQKGAPLVVIEAMKMQNELCAKSDAVVRVVRVTSGETVDRGAVLIEFE